MTLTIGDRAPDFNLPADGPLALSFRNPPRNPWPDWAPNIIAP